MKSQDEQWLLREKYNGEKTEEFFADCKALALGEPLAYLIGHAPFLDCTIDLTGRPLIPRVETEFWVHKAITSIREYQENQPGLFEDDLLVASDEHPQRTSSERGPVNPTSPTSRPAVNVLDLCSGSGCIGVAVGLLPTIQKNIDQNINQPERCAVYHSNLFASLPENKKYHFILSNPPYIDPALNRVDTNVKDFEPHLALFGGKEGTDVIAQLIAAAPSHLAPGGQLWIEHEPEQCGVIAALVQETGLTATHHPDQYDVLRYSVLV